MATSSQLGPSVGGGFFVGVLGMFSGGGGGSGFFERVWSFFSSWCGLFFCFVGWCFLVFWVVGVRVGNLCVVSRSLFLDVGVFLFL